jgi:hypothetical protein
MFFSVGGRREQPLAEGGKVVAVVSQILGANLLSG